MSETPNNTQTLLSKKTMAVVLPIVVVTLVLFFAFRNPANGKLTYHKNSGFIFGTSYNITYQSDRDYEDSIKAILDSIDYSLSPFNEKSIITAVNNNKNVDVNDDFIKVFTLAKEVNKETSGAFDITVAPLVNVCGFGLKNGKFPTDEEIDSIKSFVGFDKVRLEGRKVVKDDPRIMLDCSAIAKGYAVDKVADMLRGKGIKNFLVEIGGEIVVSGLNAQNHEWSIGITKPVDDSLSVNSDLQMVMKITNRAMATSGNYRNYYIKDGHKYAHTISPTTGKPSESDMLSATVIAPTCAEADAYATAFMVIGKERALGILQRQKDKRYILIYDIHGKTDWVVSKDLNLTK